MKIKTITLKKDLKIGLPNYSNVTAGVIINWELSDNEEFDWDRGWDIINQQLSIQADNVDPAWIQVKEYKNKYKATVNFSKNTKEGR